MRALEIESLHKSFGSAKVLRDVSFAAHGGRLLGFLGPNGAGKSTTLRIVLGLLRASSGRCRLFGQDCWEAGPELRRRVGYLPGEARFYPSLTGRVTLAFFASARRADCNAEIGRLAEAFDLDLSKRIRAYSSGMKQKLGLIQALMHRPEILILDEPTSALDPLIRQVLFSELRGAAARGAAVLFSSHTLGEVEELCDEVVILRGGEVVEQASVADLRQRALRGVEVRFGGEPPVETPEQLRNPTSRGDTLSGAWVGSVGPLLQWLQAHDVRDLILSPPNLEDLFLAYYDQSDGAK